MRVTPAFTLAAAVVACSIAVEAQQPAAPQVPRPTFETKAEIVLVDVNVVDRDARPVPTLTDTDFDFNSQQDYPSDKLIHEGDKLTTTCTFDNDSGRVVNYGESSEDEMCFNFVMMYPPNSISNIDNLCIGL